MISKYRQRIGIVSVSEITKCIEMITKMKEPITTADEAEIVENKNDFASPFF